MVTGDNIETAMAIAKEAGIILSTSNTAATQKNKSKFHQLIVFLFKYILLDILSRLFLSQIYYN